MKLTFGVDRDPMAAAAWRGRQRPPAAPRPPLSQQPNPMVEFVGAGPEGAICGDCSFLVWKGGHSRRYYGCLKRGITNGRATDHLVNWPACKAYAPDEP